MFIVEIIWPKNILFILHVLDVLAMEIWALDTLGPQKDIYGHFSVISTYNPIYRMYNPFYNQL